MSGPMTPGSPPPEVPEEFAAAYRAAYEQALAAQTGGAQHRDDREDLDEGSGNSGSGDPGPAEDTDELEAQPLPGRRGPIRVGTHKSEEARSEDTRDDTPTWFEDIRDSAWFVPFLLALLALMLIFGAYAVGRRFAGQVAGGASSDAQPRVVTGEGGRSNEKQPVTNQRPGKGAWGGTVQPIAKVRARAGCVSRSGADSSGNQVEYDAGNLTDGVADTTWRCDGAAIGEKITLALGKPLSIGQVGLIPGYAKTDEESKVDRYAENNRITRVRWRIGDITVVQKMSGSPEDRNLQLVRVPRTTTDTVRLEILAVKKGPRDTTAISEIQLGRAG